MRLDHPRITPLPQSEWTDETRALVAPVRAVAKDGIVPNVVATLVRHPRLYKSWVPMGAHVVAKSTLPPRVREILILRTGWLCQAGYEWAHHAQTAREIGMSNEDIDRIRSGPEATGWNAFEQALLQAADELHDNAFISDTTWVRLAEHLETKQLMDVVFTVGQYTLISMALNSFGIQLETGVGDPDDQ